MWLADYQQIVHSVKTVNGFEGRQRMEQHYWEQAEGETHGETHGASCQGERCQLLRGTTFGFDVSEYNHGVNLNDTCKLNDRGLQNLNVNCTLSSLGADLRWQSN